MEKPIGKPYDLSSNETYGGVKDYHFASLAKNSTQIIFHEWHI
jgi:hypothetical protein